MKRAITIACVFTILTTLVVYAPLYVMMWKEALK